ncbi:PfkB family carbohydrate kinase [Lysinimonas soli]|uniref:Ribokinase n=1 Tax=Lysinimonas soli TaxID=1074233 RepID=A0ABW0NR55_9MICO
MTAAVIVVGSVNVDLVAAGGRMPRPGETVSMARFAEAQGGKGGNQASAAAALGARTYLVGAVGSDHWGAAARADLAARGVEVSGLATVDGATGVAIILVDDDGENSIAIVPGANSAVTPVVVASALDAIDEPQAIVVACLEVPLDAVEEAARVAARRGWGFVLNPAPAPLGALPASLLAAASVITPNETELESLGGVAALLAAGAGAVVVTRGGEGAELHRAGAAPQHIAPIPADVVDTTGAGDAFTAALAVGLAEGRALPDAVSWAAVAGAIATEGFGARGSLPTSAQVQARLRS